MPRLQRKQAQATQSRMLAKIESYPYPTSFSLELTQVAGPTTNSCSTQHWPSLLKTRPAVGLPCSLSAPHLRGRAEFLSYCPVQSLQLDHRACDRRVSATPGLRLRGAPHWQHLRPWAG